MDCQDTRQLLHAYLDRELDLVRSLEMEAHLAACSGCARAYQSQQSLHKAVQKSELFFPAPATLAAALRSRLPKGEPPREPKAGLRWSWKWAGAVAAAAALIVAGSVWRSIASRRSASEMLAQEVVSAHIRSLMANHLTDVASSDQHTVKPWFAGRLDFSPPVIDLGAEGFPLVGGRLDYVTGHPAAALVYSRRKHLINLLIWPSAESPANPAQPAAKNGFNLIHWTQAGMTWWAVSDLNAGELGQFAQMMRARVQAP